MKGFCNFFSSSCCQQCKAPCVSCLSAARVGRSRFSHFLWLFWNWITLAQWQGVWLDHKTSRFASVQMRDGSAQHCRCLQELNDAMRILKITPCGCFLFRAGLSAASLPLIAPIYHLIRFKTIIAAPGAGCFTMAPSCTGSSGQETLLSRAHRPGQCQLWVTGQDVSGELTVIICDENPCYPDGYN